MATALPHLPTPELRLDPGQRLLDGPLGAKSEIPYRRLSKFLLASLVLHVGILGLLSYLEGVPAPTVDLAQEIPVELVTQPPPDLQDPPKTPDKAKEAKKSEEAKKEAKKEPAKEPDKPKPEEKPQDKQQDLAQAQSAAPPKTEASPPPKPQEEAQDKSQEKPEQKPTEAAKAAEPPKDPPKQEQPAKAEPLKAEAPKPRPAKPEPPKTQAKVEPPKPEPPKPEPPKAEPPKVEQAKAEQAKAEQAKPEQPKPEQPKAEPPKPESAQEPPKPAEAKPAQQLAAASPQQQPLSQQQLFDQAINGQQNASLGSFSQQPQQPEASAPVPPDNDPIKEAVAVPSPSADGDLVVAYKTLVFSKLELAKNYPEEARKRGAHGSAVIAFALDDKGGVRKVTLLQSSGDTALDVESLALVERAAPFPPPPPGAQKEFAAVVEFGVDPNAK